MFESASKDLTNPPMPTYNPIRAVSMFKPQINPLYSVFRVFFDPDDGGAAVAAVDSPTGSPIAAVEPPSVSAEPASVIPAGPEPTSSKVISAKDALGLPESPKDAIKGMEDALKKRVDSTTTPLPKKPKAEAPKPPVSKPTEPVKKPDAPPVAPKPPEPPKITYKGKEYTQDELTKHLEELEAKAAVSKPPEAPKPVEPPKPTKPEKSVKEQDLEFINGRLPNVNLEDYGIKLGEEELDTILSGGKEAATLFTQTLAKAMIGAELSARKWMAEQMNPVLSQISPVIEAQQSVAQYQAEQSFFQQHEDLKPYQQIVRNAATNIAKQNPEWVKTASQEDFNKFVAENVRAHLKELESMGFVPKSQQPEPVAPVPPVSSPVPTPAAPVRPQPPRGQIGGHQAPAAPNLQRSLAQDLLAHS
jgi:hypothetical protein